MNNSEAVQKRERGRRPLSADFLVQLAAAEQAQLKCAELQMEKVRKFWESMGDFPDLDVVFDALCEPCQRSGRSPDAFWLPCAACQLFINFLRPANVVRNHT